MNFNGNVYLNQQSVFPGNVTITGNITVGGVIFMSDGSDAVPSLAYTNEPSTGWERSAAGEVSFVTSGQKRAKLSSAGLTATTATVSTLITTSLTATSATISTLISTSATLTSATIPTLISTSATLTSASIPTLTSTSAAITSATIPTLSSTNVTSTNGTFTSLTNTPYQLDIYQTSFPTILSGSTSTLTWQAANTMLGWGTTLPFSTIVVPVTGWYTVTGFITFQPVVTVGRVIVYVNYNGVVQNINDALTSLTDYISISFSAQGRLLLGGNVTIQVQNIGLGSVTVNSSNVQVSTSLKN